MLINSKTTNRIARTLLWISALAVIWILFIILAYVFVRGINVVNIDFILGWPLENWEKGGIFPAIVGTLILVLVALLFAMPIGVGAAVFLTEFTKKSRVTAIIFTAADSLNAVPSIVFGLFGLAIFISYLKVGPILLAAGLTLGLMILPTIIRTSEVAIKNIPRSEKEGSYALGATKLQTIRRIILPGALPGIVTGVILGLGRTAGETAPIIFLVTLTPIIPNSLIDPVNALTYIIYVLASEATPKRIEVAFGISLVLISIVLILNYTARLLNNYLLRNMRR